MTNCLTLVNTFGNAVDHFAVSTTCLNWLIKSLKICIPGVLILPLVCYKNKHSFIIFSFGQKVLRQGDV